MGAALYAHHVLLGHTRHFVMEHAYWGQAYSAAETRSAIAATGRSAELVEDTEKLASLIVEDILAGKVIGLFQGRFEWGPRALGNRSILRSRRAENEGDRQFTHQVPRAPSVRLLLLYWE